MREERLRLGIFDLSTSHSGLTRYVLGILDDLPAGEFDVTLFCHPRTPYIPRPGVRLVPISLRGETTGTATVGVKLAAPPSRVARSIRSRLWRSLMPPGIRDVAGYVRSAVRIARYFRQYPVDLLHTNECGCMESVLAGRLARVPKVLATFHTDSAYDVLDGRLTLSYRIVERWSNRLLDGAIAVSEATRSDRVRHTGISQSRVVTIHNGIDPTRLGARPEPALARRHLGLPDDRILVGGVGQLRMYKGFDVLIKAFARVAGLYPQADLVITGTGPLHADLTNLADGLGVNGRVHFIGFQPDVLRVLAALDVFALPSRCEALPYVILEAMAAGLPVIATTVGGVPEVIEDGLSGLLVPPTRVDSMAEGIGWLLGSVSERSRLGAAARERVVRHFQQRDSAQRTIGVYRHLLTSARHLEASTETPALVSVQ